MRVRVNKRDLVTELKAIRAFQHREDKTIQLHAGGGFLHLYAYSLNASFSTQIEAMVIEPGDYCTERGKFAEVVNAVQGLDLGLSVAGGRLCLEDDAYEAKLLPSTVMFSKLNMGHATTHSLTVPGQMLSDMFSASEFAMPSDDVLSDKLGVLLEADASTTRMVTTNGHCLAMIEEPIGGSFQTQMPRRIVAQLKAAMLDAYKDVTLTLGDGFLGIAVGPRHVVTKLPAMSFPDYRLIMMQPVLSTATVSTELALRALRRIRAAVDTLVPSVLVDMGSVVTLSSSQTAKDEIEALDRVGPPASSSVNAIYLTNALEAAGQAAVIRHAGPGRPLVIVPTEGRRTFLIAAMTGQRVKVAA